MKYVLDASAAIAFLRGEPGAPKVREILVDRTNDIHIHAANAIEVRYKFTSFGGETAANEAIRDLASMGVKVFDSLPASLCSRVSFFKNRYQFLSLGDSICVAFGERLKAAVVASDRPFANIKEPGVEVKFIR